MNSESLNSKIGELRADTVLKNCLPDLPVAIFIQEASDLYAWCLMDREELLRAGLDWKYAEELPVRAELLNTLEAGWSFERMSRSESRKEWNAALRQARELRNELTHHYYHAFRFLPGERAKLGRISNAGTYADLIQGLYNLASLGDLHQKELLAIGMDPGLIENARETSNKLGKILARANEAKHTKSEKQLLRNKAFYHLKEAVEEVRTAGQYVFWKNGERYKGYISEYVRRKNNRNRKNRTRTDLLP